MWKSTPGERSTVEASRIVSVNVGSERSLLVRGRQLRTGIFKYSKPGRHRVEHGGVVGDARVDPRKLGERNHAVYAYPREHYAYFRQYHHLRCAPGHFGENLTLTGLLESDVRVGDVLRCGTTVLQALHPRIPCQKLNARMGFKFSQLFLRSGRVGYYLRVIRAGELEAGDRVQLLERDDDAPTIEELLRVTFFEYWDAEALERLALSRPLLAGWRSLVQDKLERARAAAGWLGLRELTVVEERRRGGAACLRLTCARGRALPAFQPGQYLPVSSSENAEQRVAGHRYALTGDPGEPGGYWIAAEARARTVENTPRGLLESTLPQRLGPGARVLAAAPQGDCVDLDLHRLSPLLMLTREAGVAPAASVLWQWKKKRIARAVRLVHFGEGDLAKLLSPELARLARERFIDVELAAGGRDTADALRRLSSFPLAEADVWIAGPSEWVSDVRVSLLARGARADRVQAVDFAGPAAPPLQAAQKLSSADKKAFTGSSARPLTKDNEHPHSQKGRDGMSNNINESLEKALSIDGCLGVALVDFESGLCLGTAGNAGFDLELAAAGNAEVVRAKKSIRDKLGLKDKIEDILITLNGQYHLIRMVGTKMFLYCALDRKKSNLALARRELAGVESSLDVDRS